MTTVAHDVYAAARDFLLAHREDYDAAVAGFEWPALEGPFNWAIDWFDELARGNDATALWIVEEDGGEEKYTFEQMRTRSDKLAAWLRERGLGKGDAVLLMLGNQVEMWDAMLALMKIGAVISPTTMALGTADLKDRIARAHAKGVICNVSDTGKFYWAPDSALDLHLLSVGQADGFTDIRAAQERDGAPSCELVTDVDDPLLLYFTSGTTSRPKLVEHTQTSYPVGHLSTMYWIGLEPGDVHLAISSPGWAKHAWSCFFAPWIAGATIFEYNYYRFDAAALLSQMARCGVTTFCAPPTVWRMLIQADLSHLTKPPRELVGAGEALNAEVINRVRDAWNNTIRDGYGQTEMTCSIGNSPGQPIRPGAMGRPMPGYAVALLDPATETVVEGVGEGEICLDLSVHHLGLMGGYYAADDLTAEATRGGYYHTGDIAARDEEGYLTYVGRADDVFKASDYKISPFELESALMLHAAVAECAVVPSPDALRGAVPKAYVHLAAGHAAGPDVARSIFAHCRSHLNGYQLVRIVEFVDTLPKTVSSKIRRVELRSAEAERVASGDREGQFFDRDFR